MAIELTLLRQIEESQRWLNLEKDERENKLLFWILFEAKL